MLCRWIIPFVTLPLVLTARTLEVEISNSGECRFVYEPGRPAAVYPDSVRPGALVRGWLDTDEIAAQGLRQPIRHVYVVLPPGAKPVLEIADLQSHRESEGLASPGANWAGPHREKATTTFAELTGVFRWRDFRLAHIELYPVRESTGDALLLDKIRCTVRFTQGRETTQRPRDLAVLSKLAANGVLGASWWEAPSQKALTLFSTWPEGDLFKISVGEAGLHKVTGQWLQSHGANFLGQASSKLHLLNNGGRLLPSDWNRQRDTLFVENAIFMDDGGDGRFDPEDYFLFYGQGLKGFDYNNEDSYLFDSAHQSPFSQNNVYVIQYNASGPDGLRMAALTVNLPGGQLIAETQGRVVRDDDLFIFDWDSFVESGLVWYMATIAPAEMRSFVTSLPGVRDGSGRMRLDFKRRGSGNPSLTITQNGAVLVESYYTDMPFDISIPTGVLVPGSNTLVIENHGSQSALLNFVEYEYARDLSGGGGELFFDAPAGGTGLFRYELADLTNPYVLDITAPLHPRIGRGSILVDSSWAAAPRRYCACMPERFRMPQWIGRDVHETADYNILRLAGRQADMIVLTPDEWFDMLAPLKAFHESNDEERLSVIRVKLTDVYDEFGWGNTDPVAIRDFLSYAFTNWRGPDGMGEGPRYLLLVGDGSYDYRNILSASGKNWMPPWEWQGECKDDFYTEFDTTLPYLYTGRLPVQSAAELEVAIEKIIQYGHTPLYGPWKNTAAFVADDEYKNGCKLGETDHTEDSEVIASEVLPPYFTFRKIYEILYPFRTSPTGGFKPDATRDLIECINRGTLIVNYMGHGNPEVWSDEQVFVSGRDTPLIDNGRMLGFFVAGTCSWGQFDTPLLRCHPEVLLMKMGAGAVGALAATRFTTPYSNNAFLIRFYDELFEQHWPRTSLGEALLLSKGVSQSNAEKYHLFGDPALRLATPERRARVAELSSDSLQALSLFTVSGEVLLDTVHVWEDFDGIVEARVYDNEETAVYYWCNNPQYPFEYRLPGNAIFRGTASVRQGRFSVTFRVPKDVGFGGANAKISLYFYGKDALGDSADGIGVQEHIPIASTSGSELDSVPPAITAWLETPSFQPGDPVSSSPLLYVAIGDSSGINLSGEVGHKIVARVDESVSEDLTAFFNYELNSHTRGSLEKRLGPFSQGEHRLVIEAWDSFNNVNQKTLSFLVGEEGAAGFELRDVLNWPNPMKDCTYFTYFLTQPASEVAIKIYTLTGKHVYTLDGLDAAYGFRSNSLRPWHGRDAAGHELANGVYLYRVIARTATGHRADKTGKLVILR
ncbi:MAG: type IX secretion system sortase PorU [bacterium]